MILSCVPSTDHTMADQFLQQVANAIVSAVLQSLPPTEQRLLTISNYDGQKNTQSMQW